MRRGLAESRARAQELIEAGRVTVAGAPASKAARQVAPGEAVAVAGPPPRFVSRGGWKLEGALDGFEIDVRGRRALDAGSSTGGFTDCLLQRGAAHVVALDVGTAQLHEKLRGDPRVMVHEQTNLRSVGPADIGGPVDVAVADLSFISLRTVAHALVGCLVDGGTLVVLVKPQFEAGRAEVSRGRGVISDPSVWRRVVEEVSGALVERGAVIMGAMPSPLTGADGNVEFLLHAALGAAGAPDGVDLDPVVAAAGEIRDAADRRRGRE